jgi:glycerate kinase
LGCLQALGFQFLNAAGEPLADVSPQCWEDLEQVIPPIRPFKIKLRLAVDVTNPLLGPHGTVFTFSEQKGLDKTDFSRLEQLSEKVSRLLCTACNKDWQTMTTTPGAGAAGGTAFGLTTALGAQIESGFDFLSKVYQLQKKIAEADLVITGEGRFDTSSIRGGKAPARVLKLAQASQTAVKIFAGTVDPEVFEVHPEIYAITPEGIHLNKAIEQAPQLLEEALLGSIQELAN